MRTGPAGWTLRIALTVITGLALGCGSDSALLREADAAGLKDTLEQVRSAVDARDCSVAAARLQELRSDVGNLAPPVDRELRVRLREEIVNKLAPAIEDECDAPRTETQPTVTSPAPTGPTEPAPPEPTVTKTTTTPPPTGTVETTPPPSVDPSTTTPPPDSPPEVPAPDPGGFGDGGQG